MKNLIHTTKKRLIPLLGASVLLTGGIGASALFAGGAADADTCGPVVATGVTATCGMTGTVTVGAGALTLTTPPTLGWSETINGLDQQLVDPTPADQTYTVDDATGTAPGWNITASATAFVSGANTLGTATAAGALIPTFATNGSGVGGAMADVTAPGASCAVVGGVASTCTLPTNTTAAVAYPVTITLGQAPTPALAPVTIYSADAGTGVGTIVVGAYAASVDAPAPNPVGWWVNVPSNTLAGSYVSTITLTLAAGP